MVADTPAIGATIGTIVGAQSGMDAGIPAAEAIADVPGKTKIAEGSLNSLVSDTLITVLTPGTIILINY